MKQKLLSISLLAFLLSLLASCANQIWDNGGDEMQGTKTRQSVNIRVTIPQEEGATRSGYVTPLNVGKLYLYCFDKFSDGKWHITQAVDIPVANAEISETGNDYSVRLETTTGDKLFLLLANMTPQLKLGEANVDVSPSNIITTKQDVNPQYASLTFDDFNNLTGNTNNPYNEKIYSGCAYYSVSNAQESVNILARKCFSKVDITISQVPNLDALGLYCLPEVTLCNPPSRFSICDFNISNMGYGNLGFNNTASIDIESNTYNNFPNKDTDRIQIRRNIDANGSFSVNVSPNILKDFEGNVEKNKVTHLALGLSLYPKDDRLLLKSSLGYFPANSEMIAGSTGYYVLDFKDNPDFTFCGIGLKATHTLTTGNVVPIFVNLGEAERYIAQKSLQNVTPVLCCQGVNNTVNTTAPFQYLIRLENNNASILKDKYSILRNSSYKVNITNVSTKGTSWDIATRLNSGVGYIGEMRNFTYTVKSVTPTVINSDKILDNSNL